MSPEGFGLCLRDVVVESLPSEPRAEVSEYSPSERKGRFWPHLPHKEEVTEGSSQ
jgi:hypothetical protein